jgi:hypothetical protein
LIGVPLYFHLSIKGRPSDFLLAVPSGELNVSDVFPLELSFPGDDSGSKRFETLTDFREFWEGARMPRVTFLHRVSTVAYLVVDGTVRRELALKERDRAGGTQDFRTSRVGGCPGLEIALINSHTGDTTFNTLFCADFEPGRLVISADLRTTRVPVDLRQWLIKEFSIKGVGGDFSKMFPELDRITSVYQTLGTDKIDQILRMASWGMIIVLATHTYFWLHLRAFKRAAWRSSGAMDALQHAWIGLYNDWWASFVTIITVSIFPPAVVIWAGFVSSWPFWVSASVAVIVMILAVVSARLLMANR